MHMADALISPIVGGAGWAATLGLAGYSARKINIAAEEAKVPMMGVGAAFIFAAQMLNFTIPGTGSSGHLGGGLILAALLGPHAAFLAMASVLTVQALVFADGGLLALGCNVFNLGFFPCFVVYPLLFRPIAGASPTRARLTVASMIAAIVGLQLGAFGVVLETKLSGITALPFGTFVLLMQPIHLAIGVVEGLATAAVLLFVWEARPSILHASSRPSGESRAFPKKLVVAFLAAALVMGAVFSWFASARPDGLEWSMARTSGAEELEAPSDGPHGLAASIQKLVALLPDYALPAEEADAASESEESSDPAWPAVDPGTTLAGVVGAALTLIVAGLIGLAVRRRSASKV
jgi:cobalt/nickel transport system permease protein